MSKKTELSDYVELKLVATHKETLKQFSKTITYGEWKVMVKHKDYNYLTYKI